MSESSANTTIETGSVNVDKEISPAEVEGLFNIDKRNENQQALNLDTIREGEVVNVFKDSLQVFKFSSDQVRIVFMVTM